jgi:1-acyl-sn-glycerol-3-phosphate acyltransferase
MPSWISTVKFGGGIGGVMGLAKYPWLIGKLFALAFIFGGGGVLAVGLIVLSPLIPGNRQERTQRCIRGIFRGYLWMLKFLGMLTLCVDGKEMLAAGGGRIVIANHPSLLDVVALMALIPRAQCIVKHQLWNHWFLGRLMRTAGYIRNDLDPELLVDACRLALADRRSLIIFPEGTRTILGGGVHFHRGFANIATLTGAPIQTVVISCRPNVLYKGEPWWRVPPAKPVLRLSAGECLDGNFYSRYGQRSIAARRLLEYLENYYCEKTANG